MVKVSGVPYDVDLSRIYQDNKQPDTVISDGLIEVLEQENRQMRARMERLEDENRRLEEEVIQLRIQLCNAENIIKGTV